MLLWSLGFAAVTGVMAVLLGGQDIMVRVMCTGFATSFAALLMLPMSVLIDKPKTRPAGLFGLAAVVAEFAVVLTVTWAIDTMLSNNIEESLWLMSLFVPLTGFIGFIYMLMIRSQRAVIAGFSGLGVVAVMFVLFMIAVWLPGRWYQHDEWWESGWSIAGYGILTTLCLIGVGAKDDHRHWRWLGVLSSIVALVMLLIHIWIGTGGGEKPFTLITATAMVVAWTNLFVMIPLKQGQRWLFWLSFGAAVATAAGVNFLVWTDYHFLHDFASRATGAVAIVTACGSLALLVLARLSRRVQTNVYTTDLTDIDLICPRCEQRQKVVVGRPSECQKCRLRFHVQIEEPRCPKCEYLLYDLTSDACPECGSSIAVS